MTLFDVLDMAEVGTPPFVRHRTQTVGCTKDQRKGRAQATPADSNSSWLITGYDGIYRVNDIPST
jgi:hypothetical protein